jgi:hypothetical protein
MVARRAGELKPERNTGLPEDEQNHLAVSSHHCAPPLRHRIATIKLAAGSGSGPLHRDPDIALPGRLAARVDRRPTEQRDAGAERRAERSTAFSGSFFSMRVRNASIESIVMSRFVGCR